MNNLYYCYSTKLKDFLYENGLGFISTDIHRTTDKKYWVFLRGRMLDLLLEEYSKLNNK
jgi:hypothetical protein